MTSKDDLSFIEKSLHGFKKIFSEITIDTLEHDFSPRFVEHFIKEVLGYQGNEYIFERGRTDVTLLDENKRRIVVIETKRPREDINAEKWQTQAGKYADSSTIFVGLTNGYHFLVWQVKKGGNRELKIDLNIKGLIEEKRAIESKLTTKETEQILFLENLSKQQIWDEAKYKKFNDYYAAIDVSDNEGFKKLIEHLNYISNDLMRQYTFSAFDEYYAGYYQYKQTLGELDEIKKVNKKNSKQSAEIAKFELKTEGEYKKYSSFSGYYIWKALSNRFDGKEEENKQVFCKESIYVLLNRLLFIRICEDKGLLKKKISNGGIERLREELTEPVVGDSEVFKQIIKFSYSGAQKIYSHFYEKDNPLDWYESGDGELDHVLNKVLWLLNQFNFSKVDRDILGKLYEKYLPKDERKKLGEFYTPDEVVDYILDAIEYVPTKAIDGKDIIDPACGSGGFLVRAARRLIARHAVKFGKATPKEALDNKKWLDVYEKLTPKECEEIVNSVSMHIHGFDINPFAVNITEMNLLFQIIDIYSKAVKGNPSFTVPRFKVYETDSLEITNDQTRLLQFQGAIGKSLAKDRTFTDELKKKKYDYVVGNPPWLGILKMEKQTLATYSHYLSAKGKFDIYVLFIELGAKMLNQHGKLGYITQNRFMKVGYAEALRDYITKNVALRQITDFGDIKIFTDATNYPCILVFENNSPGSFIHIEFKPRAENVAPEELLSLVKKRWSETKYNDEYFKLSTVKQETLKSSGWNLSTTGKGFLVTRLSGLETLAHYTEKITQGVTCGGEGSDDIFYVTKQKIDSFKIEERLLKKIIRGKNVREYSATSSNEDLLFPYESNAKPIDLRLYPGASKYLNQFKDRLSGRVLDGKNITQWNKEWFELWRAREPKFFEMHKIVCPRIAEKNRFAYDDTGAYLSDSVVAIIPKKINIYLLLGLLNSKLLGAYITVISPYVQGRYYNYSKGYTEKLPIKLPINKKEEMIAEQITTKVKEILKLKKKHDDTKKLEAEIDCLVFELYGIAANEQKIIEESIK
ncbi:N-6 DNA methylase [Candidatus Woesearchaeota archaeon]|nr:N-6 DNA methylase [Candidatus Woesearchaeota archaeon]